MLCIRQTLRSQQKNYSHLKNMEVNKIYIEEFKEWIAKVYEHLIKINAQNA